MKKYYLFLIILFALKCSIIAQKVEPSRTYNVIEKCYCTSFKQVGKLYNGTIVYVCTKCGKETMANPNGVGGTIEDIIELNKKEAKLVEMLKNPSASGNEEALNNMLGDYQSSAIDELSNEHYCVSFKFIDENPTGIKNYECSECGQKVKATEEWTISDIIADNKERMRIGNAALNLLKNSQQKTQSLQKNQKLSNQLKPKTTSKPQSTTTSKPQGKTTSKPSTTTKKQQTNNRSSSEVDVKQPKPTVEENLCKVSDGIDAAIDMVKKISNSGDNSCPPPESPKYNKQGSPNYDPNKEWSGSEADLQELAKIMKEKFSDEAWSHLGRDVASLKPFSLNEMIYELINGNPNGWEVHVWDKFHQDNGKSNFRVSNISDPEEILEFIAKQIQKGDKNLNIKFVRDDAGDEVVYNLTTREIIKNEKMGTFNKSALAKQQYENNVQLAQKAYEEWQQEHPIQSTKIPVFAGGVKAGVGVFQIKEEINAWKANVAVIGEHQTLDMDTNDTKAIPGNSFTRDGDQYKYVGILYERDKNDPNKFYIINGQTGEKMTAKQAYEFAATISDMWVNENHKQSVIDPLDPEYKEHLEYHEELNKNRKYTEEEIQQGLYIFRGDMMSSVPQRNNSSNPNTPKRATQKAVFGK